MRQLRAIVLIGGALAAAALVSFRYLHPNSHPHSPAAASVVQAQSSTQAPTLPRLSMVGNADGGYYYVWVRDLGSSGGRAS